MSKRYSDIARGGELKTALDNKTAWDLNTNGARKTKRLTGGTGTKRNLKTVGILPFTLKADNATMYLVKMSGKSFDTTDASTAFGKTKADNYYDATPTDANKFYDLPPSGFSAARMSTFHPTGTGTTVQYVQAKATKLYYPKREGVSFHYPIGRLIETPALDEKETKAAIRADLLTLLNATPGRSVTFKDEKAGGSR